MIQETDKFVLNSIFLPKELAASTEVKFLATGTEPVNANDQVVISFRQPYAAEGFRTQSFNYINNPDGTIRWIFPTTATSPDFLQFYHTSTLRSKAFAMGLRLAFKLGLKHRVCSGTLHVSARGETRIEHSLTELNHDTYCIFTGTCGKNRSFLAAIGSRGRTTHFLKGMIDPMESDLIYTEHHQIFKATSFGIKNAVFPESFLNKGDLIMKNVKPQNTEQQVVLGLKHFNFLTRLYEASQNSEELSGSTFAERISSGLNRIVPDERLSEDLLNMIEIHRPILDQTISVPMAFMHGDFTPWNMYLSKDKIHLIDWELSMDKAPMLMDAFHYIFQSERFLNHGNSESINHRIERMISHPKMAELIAEYNIDPLLHLRLYVLYMVAYYVPEYQRESSLSADQLAQMEAWATQLSQLTPTMKEVSHRKVFLQAFTAELAETDHALMKFKHERLTELSESSDLDILIRKFHVSALIEFIEGSSLVAKSKVIRKSYMTVIRVFFRDGSFLSIDLIYQFKRTTMDYLDPKKILEAATTNKWGLKTALPKHDLEYSLLFYTLNGAAIPAHYYDYFVDKTNADTTHLFEYLNAEFNLELERLKDVFVYSPILRNKLVQQLNNRPENVSTKGTFNKIRYYLDTLQDMLNSEGMIITFSGVDGAGKSTIIEDIKENLSNRYRKEVVVLRHRPAVLPILSAMKHGKEKANKITSTRLPRQGTNKSSISSLIRFAYYLVDYMIGQVYVGLKYTMRGKIVLYDRYYFDFIHDAKRTNIVLPPWFMKMFYPLITKPKLNFFLYAPSEVILSRKRELDAKSIEDLTHRYGTHFDSLSLKYEQDVYRKIKNTDREKTVETILSDFRAVA